MLEDISKDAMGDNNPYASPVSSANRTAKTYRPASLVLGIIAVGLIYGLSRWFKSQYSLEANVQNFIVSEILNGVSICLFFHLITKSLGLSFGWRVGLNALAAILAYALFVLVLFYWASMAELLPMILHPIAMAVLITKYVACSTITEFAMYELTTRFKKQEMPRRPRSVKKVRRGDS